MEASNILELYQPSVEIKQLSHFLTENQQHIHTKGLSGSSKAVVLASVINQGPHLALLPDREDAAYFYNDLVQLLGEEKIFFLPSSYKRSPEHGQIDTSNIILRTEALNQFTSNNNDFIIVSYPEAIIEKMPSRQDLTDSTLKIKCGEDIGQEFIVEMLATYNFKRADFVYEPGQYSVRGSIIDIYSFSNEDPYRIDFFGDDVDTIRTFDLELQLSKKNIQSIDIIPNLSSKENNKNMVSIGEFIGGNCKIWSSDISFVLDRLNDIHQKIFTKHTNEGNNHEADSVTGISLFTSPEEFFTDLKKYSIIEFSSKSYFTTRCKVEFKTSPQPVFHKNFERLEDEIQTKTAAGYKTYILSDNPKQFERLKAIYTDKGSSIEFEAINHSLHEGFIDNSNQLIFYTDHQIFERYHKFSLRTDKAKSAQQSLSLKELTRLNPGDYVVHIDHGVGRFGGLVINEENGKKQESIKLVFKDNDVLLVSIHALHRISKFKSKDGEPPKINKLGTPAWSKLKEKTKKKVKDIARELIALYAERKAEPGFAFNPDTYMQTELEASFLYEDTPDQNKATISIKKDMESNTPMDRLVCGDVGFGKTEIAVRAAFKAVADNKQVAILVPTTILALQHYNTFKERLVDFPCKVDYISRLRKTKDIKKALTTLKTGELDIIIGTHRIIGKDVEFKDLGLLIIDEEQRFGVSVKEKLKKIKVNVDTLTLTATPIPRTLQFSLMGARDLSILNTAPPNRHPIITEVHTLDEEIIKEAISYELERNGQVFFINNRVQNIYEIEALINRILPNARSVVAHGQMDGPVLEQIMMDFINGDYDILIATTIIESGLDIPNANTIIINNAHQFGLSELHQLRGRVGRSNKKAFCHLLAPPQTTLTQEARHRLNIIEEYSELGSGFNIAMQDLDIRGAGNLLGGEQSGFISDIGYETYQRILNEALLELRETEFKDLYKDDSDTTETKTYITDCQIETDEHLVFPESYIENVSERMMLYRELDNIDEEEKLVQFEKNIIDRFGNMPEQSTQLIEVVRVRWLAITLGIEKIIIKNKKLILHFISNPESDYYSSSTFSAVLNWLQHNQTRAKMKENKNRLSLILDQVSDIKEVKALLHSIQQ